MKKKVLFPIIYALIAAILYALNVPISKVLLDYINPTFLASLLYLGAGIGMSIFFALNFKKEDKNNLIKKNDTIYVILMILLDIIAPILLMLGINNGNATNASLIGNFEIVATTLIAFFIFKEPISKRLWLAILIITLSVCILSFNGDSAFEFSIGSLFVLLATLSWGLENNCTRKISNKNTYEIVALKGIFSGIGSLIITIVIGEKIKISIYLIYALLLGFVSYGLSIFFYIKAQKYIGASKTSGYYAIAPFVSALLSFVILKEKLTIMFVIALIVMIFGSALVILDTLNKKE